MEFDFNFSWDSLKDNLPTQGTKKDYTDHRFWKLSRNADGKGAAIIRLVTDKNKVPFVKVYSHFLKKAIGQNKFVYYIANSPASVNLPCPATEHYKALMAEGTKEAEQMAKKYFGRATKYYTNIYVVNDPTTPENNGKVFLWEFGEKFKAKLMSWMSPSEEDLALGETPRPLYDPINGFDIRLKCYKNDAGFIQYDTSEVAPSQTSVGGITDKETLIDLFVNKTYDLNEFKQAGYFEPYEDLEERFNKYLAVVDGTAFKKADKAEKEKKATSEQIPTGMDDFDLPEASTKTAEAAAPTASNDNWMDDL